MATLEQNIESVGQILKDIGKAINKKYADAYLEEPIILECYVDQNGNEIHATPPSEYAKIIRDIPQDLELDTNMFTARTEKWQI